MAQDHASLVDQAAFYNLASEKHRHGAVAFEWWTLLKAGIFDVFFSFFSFGLNLSPPRATFFFPTRSPRAKSVLV